MNMKCVIALVLLGFLSSNVFAEKLKIMREVVDGNGRTDTNFESYEPSYFGIVASHSNSDIVGDVKFKLSLKYKLNEDCPLYFGYTQKSYWNISEDSAPFRESNYAPELFIKKSLGFLELDYFLNVQVGLWRHESTGESGAGSRGWNTTYIEPTFCFNFKTFQCLKDEASTGNYVFFQPRLRTFALFGSKEKRAPDNTDILDYYGNFSTKITYVHGKTWQIYVDAKMGNDIPKGGMEVKLDIASHIIPYVPNDSTLKIFIQGWYGYGETLQNYNKRTDAVVIGFSAVR